MQRRGREAADPRSVEAVLAIRTEEPEQRHGCAVRLPLRALGCHSNVPMRQDGDVRISGQNQGSLPRVTVETPLVNGGRALGGTVVGWGRDAGHPAPRSHLLEHAADQPAATSRRRNVPATFSMRWTRTATSWFAMCSRMRVSVSALHRAPRTTSASAVLGNGYRNRG